MEKGHFHGRASGRFGRWWGWRLQNICVERCMENEIARQGSFANFFIKSIFYFDIMNSGSLIMFPCSAHLYWDVVAFPSPVLESCQDAQSDYRWPQIPGPLIFATRDMVSHTLQWLANVLEVLGWVPDIQHLWSGPGPLGVIHVAIDWHCPDPNLCQRAITLQLCEACWVFDERWILLFLCRPLQHAVSGWES